ncbi:MAG: 2-keto-4-pentenoate hydratase, partial [Mycolicibacterium sp.]|nr:2-keto-4-pentenoate hydratase [Mycolicibacterium sp.]
MSTKSNATSPAVITLAADQLELASTNRQPTPPVRALIGDNDIDSAYAVQQELNARRIAAGAVVIGRKIGLTS